MKEKFNVIKIIHLTICLSVLAVYFILGNLTSLDNIKIPEINTTSMVYILICTVAVFLSNFMYNKTKNKITKSTKEEDRITYFQSATIIRLVILEITAFIILFIKPEFILFGIILIIYMVFLRPTEEQFKKDFS